MAEQSDYGGPSFGGVGAYGGGLAGNPLDSIEDEDLQDTIAKAVLGIGSYGLHNTGQDMGQSVGSIADALNMSVNLGMGTKALGQGYNIGKHHPGGVKGVASQIAAGFSPNITEGYNFSSHLGDIIGGNITNFQDVPSKKSMRQAMATDIYGGLLGNPNALGINEAMDFATVANFVNQHDPKTVLDWDYETLKGFTEPALSKLNPYSSTHVTFDDDTPYGYQGWEYNGPPVEAPWGVNPLDLDNALAWNPAKVSPNILQNVEPSMEQMLDWNPLQFDTNFNTNIPNPALSPEARKSNLEEANKNIDAWLDGWINSPLSQQDNVVPLNAPWSVPSNWDVEEIENIDVGLPYDPEMAMASTAFDPWGSSVTSNISHSDTEREYAERVLYNQLAQQLAPVEPLNPPDRARPVVRPAGRQAANAPAPVRHDPIANLVRTVLSPKINQVKPAAVKAIKRGKKPDYTMMPDYQQDLVRELLNPRDSSYRAPKPAYARMDDR
jgi:hypothetical protein